MPAEPILVNPVAGAPQHEWRWRVWLAWMFVPTSVVVARHGLEDPTWWSYGAGVLLLLLAFILATVVQQTWLDPGSGRLRHRRLWVLRRELTWAEADVLRLRHNRKGLVLLQVRRPHRLLSLYVPIVGDDERGPRGQPAEVLRLLAEEIRRWAPARHHGVAAELDDQAAHLERGGGLLDSPVLLAHRGRWQLL